MNVYDAVKSCFGSRIYLIVAAMRRRHNGGRMTLEEICEEVVAVERKKQRSRSTSPTSPLDLDDEHEHCGSIGQSDEHEHVDDYVRQSVLAALELGEAAEFFAYDPVGKTYSYDE